MLFRPEKWSSSKVEKNRHFAKGLVHGFSQKIVLFLICLFWAKKSHKEAFFDILDRKECFLDLKSEGLKKSKKSTFCKGVGPWFLSKNLLFLICFFFSKKRQKETFFYILDRKQCFLDLKGEVLAKSEKSTFCIGVSPWFLAKNRPFSYDFFWAKSKKEIFFDILDRK